MLGKKDFQVHVADTWDKEGLISIISKREGDPCSQCTTEMVVAVLSMVNLIDKIYINKSSLGCSMILRVQGGPEGGEIIMNMFLFRAEVMEKLPLEE